MGSGEITDRVCNVGFEGSDGDACRVCAGGKFKAEAARALAHIVRLGEV